MSNESYTEQDLRDAVIKSFSISAVLRKLNIPITGGASRKIILHCTSLGIDTSHFRGVGNKGETAFDNPKLRRKSTAQIFTEHSNASSAYVRSLVIKLNLFPYVCSICNMEPVWQGSRLQLQLDHINGIRTDQRLENLRWMCPNCHSQTDTFCGKNKKKSNKSDADFIDALQTSSTLRQALMKLGLDNSRNYERAKKIIAAYNISLLPKPNRSPVLNYDRPTKIDWPEDKQLYDNVMSHGYTIVAKDLGVSSNAVKKRLKVKGYQVPRYHTQMKAGWSMVLDTDRDIA
jgi:hypothetical protein